MNNRKIFKDSSFSNVY